MRKWLMLWLCGLLVGCADVPKAPEVQAVRQLFDDGAFAAPSDRIRAEDVFALSPEMQRYLLKNITTQVRNKGGQRALVEALYKPGQLKLDYDSARTRNAAEAFDARAGNCLSLVIMTAAFAKAMNLSVDYQSAYTEETWSRSGTLYFRSGHVNVTLGRRLVDTSRTIGLSPLTIDFLPSEEVRGLRSRSISEATVIAMYMNNRAAEAIVEGRLDDAYAWAREAILQDPRFLSAANTLGVIYERHGNLDRASEVLRHVLEREPDNPRALANLSQVMARLGDAAESRRLADRLAQIEPRPAYYYFELGRLAMERGDFRAARDHFAKEVDRAGYNAEFHFWLGLASYRLGDTEAARRQLTFAMENSTTRGDRDLYAAKLAWMRSLGAPVLRVKDGS